VLFELSAEAAVAALAFPYFLYSSSVS